MTITQMLSQSGLLTLLGMAVVFSFLIIMILCMNLLRICVHALKLDKEEAKTTSAQSTVAKTTVATTTPQGQDSAVVAAIAAAVHDKIINNA